MLPLTRRGAAACGAVILDGKPGAFSGKTKNKNTDDHHSESHSVTLFCLSPFFNPVANKHTISHWEACRFLNSSF
jgi:hypothetical protein